MKKRLITGFILLAVLIPLVVIEALLPAFYVVAVGFTAIGSYEMLKLYQHEKKYSFGVKAVITKSFARIHCANLINAGILPLNFANADDYDKITQGDELSLKGIKNAIINNEPAVLVNLTTGEEYEIKYDLSQRQKDIILAGGLLNYTKESF